MFFTTLLDSLWTHRKRDLLQLGCLLTMCSAERSQFHSKYKKLTDLQSGAFNVFKDTERNFSSQFHALKSRLTLEKSLPPTIGWWTYSAQWCGVLEPFSCNKWLWGLSFTVRTQHECRILADSWLMPGIESVDRMPDWVISENGDIGNNLPLDRKGEKVI